MRDEYLLSLLLLCLLVGKLVVDEIVQSDNGPKYYTTCLFSTSNISNPNVLENANSKLTVDSAMITSKAKKNFKRN